MITVTDKAAEELIALLKAKDAPEGSGLRLGVERGGCAGLAYTMRVGVVEEGDEVIDLAGTRFIVAADSFDFLLADSRFSIQMPLAHAVAELPSSLAKKARSRNTTLPLMALSVSKGWPSKKSKSL